MIKMSTKSLSKLKAVLTKAFTGKLAESEVSTVLENHDSELTKVLSHRTKRKKDANAPKKWKTGYILFCQDNRDKIKEKNPELKTTEITSRLGNMWKSLKPAEREKYNKRSSVDKERYTNEMKNYVPPPGEAGETKTRRKRDKTNHVKKPISAYFLFCNDNREKIKTENPSLNNKEVTVELGRRWKSLTDKEKAPYTEKATADKSRYEAEKARVQSATQDTTQPTQSTQSTQPTQSTPVQEETKSKKKGRPAKEKSSTSKPSKEKSSKKEPGFTLFCQERQDEVRRKNSAWSTDKVMNELEKQWNKLKPEDRQVYNDDAEDAEENVSLAALEDD